MVLLFQNRGLAMQRRAMPGILRDHGRTHVEEGVNRDKKVLMEKTDDSCVIHQGKPVYLYQLLLIAAFSTDSVLVVP